VGEYVAADLLLHDPQVAPHRVPWGSFCVGGGPGHKATQHGAHRITSRTMDLHPSVAPSGEVDHPAIMRSGFVTLFGEPNVGKSTLLNALVGEHLSIVTPLPQTTWRRVAGIRTEGATQMIFVDTPGILFSQSLMHRSLLAEAQQAIQDADVAVLILDATRPPSAQTRDRLEDLLDSVPAPRISVANKSDAADPRVMEELRTWSEAQLGALPLPISALHGEGLDELLGAIESRLPESPRLFPEDEIAIAPLRFFVTELVRETVFEQYRQEIPFSTFCEVEEFREDNDRIYIQINVFVERSSQKGIMVGKGGEAIRELGRASRTKIEHFLGKAVYLDLWIKVLPKWRKKRAQLRRLGLPVPDSDVSPPQS
jgi:GTPase